MTRRPHDIGPFVFLCLALLTGTPVAHAQPRAATSFEQLQVLVEPGDRVTVTDATGREVTGRIESLSTTSLALIVDGTARDLAEHEVERIRQRRADSLANGAAWGFGIGAGLATALMAAYAASDADDAGDAVALLPVVALVYGGLGAGIGVGLDAMTINTQVIYARPSASAARVRVSPFLAARRTGVALSVRF